MIFIKYFLVVFPACLVPLPSLDSSFALKIIIIIICFHNRTLSIIYIQIPNTFLYQRVINTSNTYDAQRLSMFHMTPPIWNISVSGSMFHMDAFWNMIWHVSLGYPLLKHPVKNTIILWWLFKKCGLCCLSLYPHSVFVCVHDIH